MRIGLIAPPWIPVPPPAYGGTEEVIDNLARGLTALGHDVRLFTVGESTCPVPRQWLYRSPAERMGASAPEAAHVLAAYQALAGDVDIIHDHTDLGPVLAGQHGMARQPVVTTIHGQVAGNRCRLAQAARHASIVAISHAHARSFGPIPVAAVIHHGIDLDIHKAGPGPAVKKSVLQKNIGCVDTNACKGGVRGGGRSRSGLRSRHSPTPPAKGGARHYQGLPSLAQGGVVGHDRSGCGSRYISAKGLSEGTGHVMGYATITPPTPFARGGKGALCRYRLRLSIPLSGPCRKPPRPAAR